MVRALLAFLVTCLSFACAQEPLAPVSRREAWQAVSAYLRARGSSDERLPKITDLELPGTISAPRERTLRVAAVCWESQMERAAFRLECAAPSSCMPLLVYGAIEEAAFRKLLLSRETEISPACFHQNGTRAAKTGRQTTVVRPGDRAIVVFRGEQLRLSAQVTCLERGVASDIIRVRNSDGVLFRARVVAPGQLETLPQ